MKQSVLLFAFILLAVSCVSDYEPDCANITINSHSYYAGFEDAEAKVYIDSNLKQHWTAGDEISVFTSTKGARYRFEGQTGATSGSFSLVSEPDDGYQTQSTYAVYPYNENSYISNEIITVFFPDIQYYAENSFGLGANTMVAVTERGSEQLSFKNLCGYLVVYLYGEGTVKSISLTGNNYEKIAGRAYVSIEKGQSPSIEMSYTYDTTTSIKLDCGEGVELGKTADEATAFWIAVPPVSFSSGFSIWVDFEGTGLVRKFTSSERTISRNTVNRISPICSESVWTITSNSPGTISSMLNNLRYSLGSTDDIQSIRIIGEVDNNDLTAISNLRNLKYLDLREAKVNSLCFWYNSTLETVFLPDDMEEIPRDAFRQCNALRYVYGANVKTIGMDAFGSCIALSDYYLPNVKEIHYQAFGWCSSLEKIVFPEAKLIENQAFTGCDAVRIVSLDALEELDSSVLTGMTNIESLNLPRLLKIADGALKGQSKLKTLHLPELIELGSQIIKDSSIEEINCPSLKTIPDYAFSNNYNLRRAFFKNVKTVGVSAFHNCERLKDVNLHEATDLERCAFYGCTLGGDLDFMHVNIIGESCFENSTGLGSSPVVLFPLAVWIGSRAFANCINLISIEIPLAICINSQAFWGCSKLVTVSPNNILIATEIQDHVFYGCTLLSHLEFPCLNILGTSCFDNSGIKWLSFGNLRWKEVNEYGWPLDPFEFWTFPIYGDSEWISQIHLTINDVEATPVFDEYHPWWSNQNGVVSFLNRHWASVTPYK